jgi:hypothetical protein
MAASATRSQGLPSLDAPMQKLNQHESYLKSKRALAWFIEKHVLSRRLSTADTSYGSNLGSISTVTVAPTPEHSVSARLRDRTRKPDVKPKSKLSAPDRPLYYSRGQPKAHQQFLHQSFIAIASELDEIGTDRELDEASVFAHHESFRDGAVSGQDSSAYRARLRKDFERHVEDECRHLENLVMQRQDEIKTLTYKWYDLQRTLEMTRYATASRKSRLTITAPTIMNKPQANRGREDGESSPGRKPDRKPTAQNQIFDAEQIQQKKEEDVDNWSAELKSNQELE